jgi:hypothetical protein
MSAEREYWASGGQCFIDGQWRYLVDKDKADVFIAELEALRTQYDACRKTCLQRDALIDELAALKGRRCFDCKLFTYTDCPVWPAFHRGETVDTLPSDYHCSLWTPRKDGEL